MIHADVLAERTRLTPGRLALVCVATGERLTYRVLDERADRVAAALTNVLGLTKGDRVGLLAHNRVEFVAAFFAAARCGLVLVPLGTRLTARELAPIAADAGLSVLLYDGALGFVVNELDDVLGDVRFVALDVPVRASHPRLGELAHGDARVAAVHPEDPVCLLYTSGTTGKPKGVVIPHRQVAFNGAVTALAWGLREDDVSPIFTPLYHAGGLFAFLVPIFTAGGTIVLHEGFDAPEVVETIAKERATVVLGVPTIWKMLAESRAFESADLSSVRWLVSGGAPLPVSVLSTYHARGLVMRQGYGLTEVGVNCFAMTSEDAIAKAGSIGKPMPFTQVRLVDDTGRDVPAGVPGELCFRGPHVSKGYWNAPEATAAVFDAGGWFHTGDVASRDAEGFFTIVGRKKEMFISGGVNVYPAEIEAALLAHPDVADAAVVGAPHETWGEIGVAFVVSRGVPPTPEALSAFLEERLARFKVPKEFVFWPALPRTAYGKVVKGELVGAWRKAQA